MAKNRVTSIMAIGLRGKTEICIHRLNGTIGVYPMPASARLQLVLEDALIGAFVNLYSNEVSAIKYFEPGPLVQISTEE